MKFHLVLLLAVCCTSPFSLAAELCLHYEEDPVTLGGKVMERTFYGPPGYGESPNIDSRETQGILLLSKPVCVDENPSDYYKAEKNQSEVTLVPLGNTNLKGYIGKRVIVQGKLFHATTGHHHTPVLIEVIRIEKSSSRRAQ